MTLFAHLTYQNAHPRVSSS